MNMNVNSVNPNFGIKPRLQSANLLKKTGSQGVNQKSSHMLRNTLLALAAVAAGGIGLYAYQASQEDTNEAKIETIISADSASREKTFEFISNDEFMKTYADEMKKQILDVAVNNPDLNKDGSVLSFLQGYDCAIGATPKGTLQEYYLEAMQYKASQSIKDTKQLILKLSNCQTILEKGGGNPADYPPFPSFRL